MSKGKDFRAPASAVSTTTGRCPTSRKRGRRAPLAASPRAASARRRWAAVARAGGRSADRRGRQMVQGGQGLWLRRIGERPRRRVSARQRLARLGPRFCPGRCQTQGDRRRRRQGRSGHAGPRGRRRRHRRTPAALVQPSGARAAAAPRPPDPSTAVALGGKVKWFDDTKGFGFVASDDGGKDVFVHISILGPAGISRLAEGQHVNMRVVDTPKGREAISITF